MVGYMIEEQSALFGRKKRSAALFICGILPIRLRIANKKRTVYLENDPDTTDIQNQSPISRRMSISQLWE